MTPLMLVSARGSWQKSFPGSRFPPGRTSFPGTTKTHEINVLSCSQTSRSQWLSGNNNIQWNQCFPGVPVLLSKERGIVGNDPLLAVYAHGVEISMPCRASVRRRRWLPQEALRPFTHPSGDVNETQRKRTT